MNLIERILVFFGKRYSYTFRKILIDQIMEMEDWCKKRNIEVKIKTKPQLYSKIVYPYPPVAIEYACEFGFDTVKFSFKDPEHLLLFKLAWG